MKCSETHEWIEIKDEVGTVGVTEYAQKELGDIVYIELPKTGSVVKKGGEVVVLESTKAASDVYSPVSGTIVAINEALKTTPELVNASAEERGWLYKINLTNPDELNNLIDIKDYKDKYR